MRLFLQSIFQIEGSIGKNRNVLLEVLRGTTMILVLLQHSDAPYGEWILAFHMPFLFFLSGYTDFCFEKAVDFRTYLKNRFFRLIVPYLFFETMNMLVWSVQCIVNGMIPNVAMAVRDIICCWDTAAYTGLYGRLWFFPCMFFSSLYLYVIKKVCRGKKWMLCTCAVILLGCSWFTSDVLQNRMPLTLDTACYAAFFMAIGYTFGKQVNWLLCRKNLQLVPAFAVLILLMGACMNTGNVQCHMFRNVYGNYMYTFAAAVCGSCSFLIIGKWLCLVLNRVPFLKKTVLWYGYHSLLVYPVHATIRFAMWFFLPSEWCRWYCLFIVMLLVTIPAVNFLSKYAPFTMGKFSGKRTVKSTLPH